MPAYFEPLRRKIGVVMLAIACVFAAGWVRSKSRSDYVTLRANNHRIYYVLSVNGWVGCIIYHDPKHEFPKAFATDWSAVDFDGSFDPFAVTHYSWSDEFQGFFHIEDSAPHSHLILRDWSIVIPLTVLSVWLLLSRPRAKKMKQAAPAPN